MALPPRLMTLPAHGGNVDRRTSLTRAPPLWRACSPTFLQDSRHGDASSVLCIHCIYIKEESVVLPLKAGRDGAHSSPHPRPSYMGPLRSDQFRLASTTLPSPHRGSPPLPVSLPCRALGSCGLEKPLHSNRTLVPFRPFTFSPRVGRLLREHTPRCWLVPPYCRRRLLTITKVWTCLS